MGKTQQRILNENGDGELRMSNVIAYNIDGKGAFHPTLWIKFMSLGEAAVERVLA
jgi:hypothetical protein